MNYSEQTTLADLNIVRQLTNTLGNGTKKNFGQNFLINQNSLLKFVKSIDINEDDVVVEIGPGIGVISYTLCQNAKKVYLIEIDRDKEAALSKTLENFSNYKIIWDDASTIDWKAIQNEIYTENPELEGRAIKVIGSLPYNVGKRIIYNFLTTEINWSEASFFLQREVADNFTSQSPQAEFLSNFAQIFSEIEFAFGIPAEHFYPKPSVKTGVVHLIKSDIFDGINKVKFSEFIKTGFTQPRKTLLNNLKLLGLSKEILLKLGLKETVRPGELHIDQWFSLYKEIKLEV